MIESLMALVIISMIAIFVSYVPNIKKAKYDNDTIINYYSFLNTLESDNYKFVLKNARNGYIKLYSRNKNKVYNILDNKNVIYLRNSSSRGYVPLLNDVKQLETNIVNQHLKIVVTFVNGDKYTNNVVIPYEK